MHYTGLTVRRGIKRHEVNTMNIKELLFDLQTTVDSLKDTIELIKAGASKNDSAQYLRIDANLLRHVIDCLDNGGYDND